jgi:signal transduction histidine kinase
LGKKEQSEKRSPLEISDEEEALNDWFESKEIEEGWLMAPVFVQYGIEVAELEKIASSYPHEILEPVFVFISKSIEVATITEVIEQSTQSISSLVNVVKSYSFMDQAAVQYININDGIEDTLKILGHKMTPEIEIIKEFQQDLPKIQTVGSELNQVWTNLLDNALCAVNGKGRITIRTSAVDDHLKVEIEDSGTGIPKDIWDRIFDPFFTTKEVGEGTGLGLDVVRRIVVNRIGGEISFESKPGETTFKVLLPLKRGNKGKSIPN